MRQRIHSTARSILAASLLIPAIVIGMFAYLAWEEFQRAGIEKSELLSSRVQIVATHAEWLVSAGKQTLHVAESIAGESFPNIAPDKTAGISAIVEDLPGSARLSFLDLQGNPVFSTNKEPEAWTLDDLEEILTVKTEDDPYISVLNPRKGVENFVVISRPVRRDGKILGIASLRFPVGELLSLWSEVNLGPQSTIGLVRDDGRLVARYPAPNEPVNLSNYELFTEHLKKADRGTYSTISPVDNVNRIVGYQRVPNTPLIAIAAAAETFASQPLRKYYLSLATLLAGLLALAALVGWWTSSLLAEDDKRKAQLAENVEKTTLLLGEIHHRVKNNLQAVASLVQLQSIDPDVKRDMRLRIEAMAAVHEQSYELEQFADVDVANYLQTLVDNARNSHGRDIVIESDLVSMTVNRDIALPLGLIANEVISNASKHAFKGRSSPSIKIKLARLNENEAEVIIADNGIGYPEELKRNGMGSRLIKAFALQIGGRYAFENDNGTLFRMTFPAPTGQG